MDEAATPAAAILRLSGPKGGRTDRLSGDTLHVEPTARGGAAIIPPGRSRGAPRIAILQRSGASYTLRADPEQMPMLKASPRFSVLR